jgi:hypothetical protein
MATDDDGGQPLPEGVRVLRETCVAAAALSEALRAVNRDSVWPEMVDRWWALWGYYFPTQEAPPRPHCASALDVAGAADVFLRALEALEAGRATGRVSPPPAPALPTAPTPGYCLPERCVLQWEGRRKVRPALWRLLGCLLRHGGRVPFRRLREEAYGKAAGGKGDGSIRNDLSALNVAMRELNFPWQIGVDTDKRTRVLFGVLRCDAITNESQSNHR